ncbi:hypothetical protein BAUCODRAFT_124676 [Baudoinia panamericana UAMH 10762]|uniref:UBX domain-containing protein n=1 Tax=Baudoinia panamericana (strain UAMH 10762) TaxID=717646 RepID=M2LID2_BAUPA|nr:uncharacterized protein BAUCODRAFT_124676 [Baudoinia panamericana UAMH 10762]EMC93927.1 hypothetical protein BAUCODRAFT_124676 [Baudoinia panamericana UAMH 10762]
MSGSMSAEQQDKVAQFSAITGANPSAAVTALQSANWNLEEAVGLFYAAADEPQEDEDDVDEQDQPTHQTAQAPVPSTSSQPSSSSQKPSGQRPKQMSLRDLLRGDDDGEEEDKNQDMFAGGEKSGLAVQNPDNRGGPPDHFKNIMNQARANRDRPKAADEDEDEPQPTRSSHFTGRAQTLGGDDAPSQVLEDAAATRAQGGQRQPRVTRTLHLWSDGVSIDDGPLFRFDDPANQDMMTQINQGRAPLSMLDVQPDQEVDLSLAPHRGENYVQPKKQYKPFGGSGQRLGSPTPGLPPASSSSTTSTAPRSQQAPATSATSQSPAQVEVDESAPVVQLQIRLGDGTQMRSRFNTSHTIGDVYDFVNRASPASTQRAYALMTTFPSKELSDKSQVLGDIADFKRGGVVVQKWV